MCDLCDFVGLEWAVCSTCGDDFMFTRWNFEKAGPPSSGIPAGTPEAENAMESASWTGAFSPGHCVECSPSGYVHPPVDPETLAWMQGQGRPHRG